MECQDGVTVVILHTVTVLTNPKTIDGTKLCCWSAGLDLEQNGAQMRRAGTGMAVVKQIFVRLTYLLGECVQSR